MNTPTVIFLIVLSMASLAIIIVLLIEIHKIIKGQGGLKPTIQPWNASEVFFINHQIKTGGDITMQKAKVDQKFNVNWPGPKDKYGNDAVVQEGSVAFSSDDEEIATVSANPDAGAYAATITTQKKPGATAIRIKAVDGDGEGDLSGMLAVEVSPGDAIAFGDPVTDEPVDNTDTPE